MSRVLPVLLSIGLTVYCLIDALQTDESAMRNLPKPFWLLLILLFPIVGPLAWIFAGRPVSTFRRATLLAHAVSVAPCRSARSSATRVRLRPCWVFPSNNRGKAGSWEERSSD